MLHIICIMCVHTILYYNEQIVEYTETINKDANEKMVEYTETTNKDANEIEISCATLSFGCMVTEH